MWLYPTGTSALKISVSSVIGAVGGFAVWFLGGIDTLLITLVTFIALDYVTGVIRAVYEKKLSSSVGYRGIIKKVLMLIMVGVSVSLQNILPQGVPLREMTVMFFIANEGFSVLENAAGVIPLPAKLKSVLAQIQKKSEDNQNSEDMKADNAADKDSDCEKTGE